MMLMNIGKWKEWLVEKNINKQIIKGKLASER